MLITVERFAASPNAWKKKKRKANCYRTGKEEKGENHCLVGEVTTGRKFYWKKSPLKKGKMRKSRNNMEKQGRGSTRTEKPTHHLYAQRGDPVF